MISPDSGALLRLRADAGQPQSWLEDVWAASSTERADVDGGGDEDDVLTLLEQSEMVLAAAVAHTAGPDAVIYLGLKDVCAPPAAARATHASC